MNILLAADGSDYTKRAARFLADYVAQLAKPPQVSLLHVHAPLPYNRAVAVVGKKAVEKYQLEECEKALQVAEKELRKAGVDYEAHWMVGEISASVKAFVKDHDIDLVVMGSHGHTALGNLALGSVATKLLASLKTPILIVR